MCVHVNTSTCIAAVCVYVCVSMLSSQDLFRQIARYGMGVGIWVVMYINFENETLLLAIIKIISRTLMEVHLTA